MSAAVSEIRYVDYQPRGAARELFRRRESIVVLSGPAGTGKTRGLIEKIHACCEKYPKLRALMIRKTRASLNNTGVVCYEQEVLPDPDAVKFRTDDQEYRYPNGSILGLAGLDKVSKIMSSQYDIMALLEGTEATQDDVEKLTTRLRNGRMPYQQIVIDCNPAEPRHWLKQKADSGAAVMLESRHEDNPVLWDGENWTAKGAAYIKILDELTGVRYLRLRKGIWAAAEGMIYDSWDPKAHLIDRREIPKEWPRIWAVDFGFTNPFVWQAWAIDPDGRLIRYKEIYKTQTLVENHARQIRDEMHYEPVPLAIICDHDAEDRATLERYLGLPTLAAFKSVSPGIQAVQRRLKIAGDGKPRIMFMRDSLLEVDQALRAARKPTCTEEEIEGYVWDQREGHLEEPVKRDDHGCDCARYVTAAVDHIQRDISTTPETITHDEDFYISPY